MIAFLMIAGLGVLALLSRLAALTRMTIPLLYTVSMLTVFHGWYRAHIQSKNCLSRYYRCFQAIQTTCRLLQEFPKKW